MALSELTPAPLPPPPAWTPLEEARLLARKIHVGAGLALCVPMMLSFLVTREEPQAWLIFALQLAWLIGFGFALPWTLNRRDAKALYIMLPLFGVLACLFMLYQASHTPIIISTISVIMISLLLRFQVALALMLALSLLALSFLAKGQVSEFLLPARWLSIFPMSASFIFGASLRQSLLARAKAEVLSQHLSQLNQALKTALRAADDLAVAHERARLARELHDSIGHCLTIGAVQVEAAQRLLERNDGERALRSLALAQDSIKSGLGELRSCVSVLRDESTDHTLSSTLRELIEGASVPDCEVTLEILGQESRLNTAAEFLCFRATQEALTNITKHAKASRVRISLIYTPQTLELKVYDNGQGCAELTPGHGLTGLQERAASLNGELSIESPQQGGFLVHVTLKR